MLIKTILNDCHKFKSFVYQDARFSRNDDGSTCIHIPILPRKNGHLICSGCGRYASGYDSPLGVRKFEFIPFWGYPVFFLYQMRRVDCPSCGVKVEKVPWADGKNHLSKVYMQFLANWAKALSWKEVSVRFIISIPKAHAQAREHSITMPQEMAHLLAHGFLHLLGHDHGDEMFAREAELVRSIYQYCSWEK